MASLYDFFKVLVSTSSFIFLSRNNRSLIQNFRNLFQIILCSVFSFATLLFLLFNQLFLQTFRKKFHSNFVIILFLFFCRNFIYRHCSRNTLDINTSRDLKKVNHVSSLSQAETSETLSTILNVRSRKCFIFKGTKKYEEYECRFRLDRPIHVSCST